MQWGEQFVGVVEYILIIRLNKGEERRNGLSWFDKCFYCYDKRILGSNDTKEMLWAFYGLNKCKYEYISRLGQMYT